MLRTLCLALLVGCTCNRIDPSTTSERSAAHRVDPARKLGKQQGRPTIARQDVEVWFVDQAKLTAGEDPWVKLVRKVGARQPAKNALWVLFKGPTPAEQQAGLHLFRNGAEGFDGFTLEGDTVTVRLRGGCRAEGGTITIYDHIQRTLEAFPDIEHVKVLDPAGRTQDPEGPTDSRPACLEP